MKRWAIVAVLLLAGSAAMAQAWRPFQFGFGAGGGTISPPPSCAGVIDLSVGCIVPGLGP